MAQSTKKKRFVFQERALDMNQEILSKRQLRHMGATRISRQEE
jgi:hypothetical protein